jgi:acetyl esterase/lipase
MDTLYLVVSINGALYTLNAHRPLALRRGPIAVVSWASAGLTIELAWLHLVGQIAMTAWFARRGALRSRRGKLGLVLNVATWIGLGALVGRSLGVRHEVRTAFRELDAGQPPKAGRGVAVTRNIPFAHVGRKPLKLDVYAPRDARPGERRPAILQIHGGAWVMGDKREQGIPLLRHLARQGWVGFNANYRLSPQATFPDQLVDLKRAVAWIREHADEYAIDPDFLVVTGGSAGGHLAALVALTANDPRYQPGFENADTSVQACVPFYGVYDFTNRNGHYPQTTVDDLFGGRVLKASLATDPAKFAEASPMDQVGPGAPPFLVIHGDADTLVPVGIARDFVAELRQASNAPVLYLELKGAQHAFDVLPSIRGWQVIRAVDRFVASLWDAHRSGQKPGDVPAEDLAGTVGGATAEDVTA